MRKIKNRVTLLFLIFIMISNFLALITDFGLLNEKNSLFDKYSSFNFDNKMLFSNQEEILGQITSQTSANGGPPKISSLNDDLYPNWWIEAIGAENLDYNGSGVRVAILDTGIYDSSDYNVVLEKDFVDDDSTTYDGYGHGTHVAGIIGGNGDGSSGKYRGVAPGALLIDAQIGNLTGGIEVDDVVAAINWASTTGNADIISMSFGYSYPEVHNDITQALSDATENGVICVASAGNSGPDYFTGSYPAAGIDVITVGATDKNNQLASFSSWGPSYTNLAYPDVVAPGVDIISAEAKNSYISKLERFTGNYFEYSGNADYIPASGTSMSCPMVAGALAILLEAYPSLTPETARIALIEGSQSLSSNSDDYYLKSGVGLINVSASLKYLEEKTGDLNDIAVILPDFLPVKPYDLLHFPGDYQRFNLTIISGKSNIYDIGIPSVEGVSLSLDNSQVSFSDQGVNFTALDIEIEKDAVPGIRNFQLNLTKGGSLYDSINISLEIRLPEHHILMESFHGLNDWLPEYSFYQMGFYEAMNDISEMNISIDYTMEYWTPDYNKSTDNSILTEEKLAQYDLVVLQNPILPYSPLEVNNLKQFFDNGGNILFLGTRYQDLCVESINNLFSTLEVDIGINQENVMDDSWLGIGASVSSQNATVDNSHVIFTGVDTFYWLYGNSFTTSGNAESIATIEGKTITAAYNGSSQGKGSIVAFGDLFWIFNRYDSPGYVQTHSQLLTNLINYYFDEDEEVYSINIDLSSESVAESAPQLNISIYVKNQLTELPLSSSLLKTNLSVSIENASDSFPISMNSTIDGIATNYSLDLSNYFNPSYIPLMIEVNLTIATKTFRKQSKVLYYDVSKVPSIKSFESSASSVNRSNSIDFDSELNLPSCTVSGYMGIYSYSFYNSKQTTNKTLTFTDSGTDYNCQVSIDTDDPSGYAITYIVPESIDNYIDPHSPRVLFSIINIDPEISDSDSTFNYGVGDVPFSDTRDEDTGGLYYFPSSQLTNVRFNVDVSDSINETDDSEMRVFVNIFICAIISDGSNSYIVLLPPSSFEVSELSFISTEHAGSLTIPLTMEFSTISGNKPVSTVANYYNGYLGIFYVTVYDSEGGSDEYYFLVAINPASPTFDPILTLIIFGVIMAVSIIIIVGLILSQRGKPRTPPRSQYYQEYYYPTPEERQNYPSEYYSEKIPVSPSEFQQEGLYFCPFCGKNLNVLRKYCPHCGESLTDL